MNDFRCSVVMPVHNGKRFLQEAIESVLAQTYNDFEFLIIENGSTDSSIDIVSSYDDPRIRIIVEKKIGQVYAYNRGFREANGHFIFVADQDDISDLNRIRKQLSHIQNEHADICGTSFNIMNEAGKIIGHQEVPCKHSNIITELYYKNHTLFNPTLCIRKKVFEQCGYFNPIFFPSADYEFYLRVKTFFECRNIPEYLYSWRIHSEQISTNYRDETQKQSLSISLAAIERDKGYFDHINYLQLKGLIYYYNNSLIKALMFLIRALTAGKEFSLTLKYLLKILVFGLPVKILRKLNLTYSIWYRRKVNMYNNLFKNELV